MSSTWLVWILVLIEIVRMSKIQVQIVMNDRKIYCLYVASIIYEDSKLMLISDTDIKHSGVFFFIRQIDFFNFVDLIASCIPVKSNVKLKCINDYLVN